MLANTNISLKLPSMQAIVCYLVAMGVLATLALALVLLLFLAYLFQLLFTSIGEVCTAFNCLDPLVRLLLIALGTVLVAWRFSSKGKVKYGY